MNEPTYNVIREVWDELSNEKERQDQSHWRGVGRWSDDSKWQEVGKASLGRVNALRRFLGQPNVRQEHRQVVLEWGPGGGANVFAFRELAAVYHGVDISRKNLTEVSRLLSAEPAAVDFRPHLLADPAVPLTNIEPGTIDVFLSTAVFQHFPTKEYGIAVLNHVVKLCKSGSVAVIQIRFDNENPKYKSNTSIADYKDRFITANSYRLDEFWNICADAGFQPVFIRDINSKVNYAVFYLRKL